MIDLTMLAALLAGPAYGYALKKTAGLIFAAEAMHNNVVYPALARFARNGWVTAASVPGERGQPRKQYRITPAGRKHLLDQLGTFEAAQAADRGAFLLRVALFDALPKTKRGPIVRTRETYLTSRAARLRELREATHASGFAALVIARVCAETEDELRWVRQLTTQLESQ